MEEEKSNSIKDPAEGLEFTPTYKVHELPENEKSKYNFSSKEDKIKEAQRLKEEGNKHFAQKDYKKALSSYSRVFLFLNGFLAKEDPNYMYLKDEQSKLSESEKSIVDDLKFTTYLNMAQIDLFNKKYPKCIERCNMAMKIKENAKVFYRRGCAYLETNDIEYARKDFDKVKELDPSFTAIGEKYAILKEREKLADKQLKSKLKKMFD